MSFYVATFHLLLYFRIGKPQRISLVFSAACFVSGTYDILCTGLYLATTFMEGAAWQQWQLIMECFWSFTVLLFTFEYTSHNNRVISYLILIYYFCVAILTLVNPGEIIIQSSNPAIKTINIGPGVQIIYYEVVSGPLKDITYIVIFLMLC